MLSLPDFKEKQILFISAGDIDIDKIRFVNDNICLIKKDKIENQISCHRIFSVFIIGDCSMTSVFIRNCRKYGVSVFLMNRNFNTYARILSSADGNYIARLKQYSASEENKLMAARNLVSNKISNQSKLLARMEKVDSVGSLSELRNKINGAKNTNDLLGIEGSASKKFFHDYFLEMGWYKRSPQTRIDIINLLMDIGYTFLFNFVDGMVGIYGLDPYVGFYHKLFFQRKSLSCDLMEPFRSIIDKQILKSNNLSQINSSDFKNRRGAFQIDYDKRDKYLEIFARAIMDNKEEIFTYVRDYYYFLMNGADFPEFNIQ